MKRPYLRTISRGRKNVYFLCSSVNVAMRMKSCGTKLDFGKCSVEMTCRKRMMIHKMRMICAKAMTCKRETTCRRKMIYVMEMIGMKKRRNSISLKNYSSEMDCCILMCIRMRICSLWLFEELMSTCHSCF
jgi:hypothetical protein